MQERREKTASIYFLVQIPKKIQHLACKNRGAKTVSIYFLGGAGL